MMESKYYFTVEDVDPRENKVWLTIDIRDRDQIINIRTLMEITDDPDDQDSLVNAYVVAHAIIPKYVLWDIVYRMVDKETELGLRDQIDLDLKHINLKVFFKVSVGEKILTDNEKCNYTDLAIRIYVPDYPNGEMNIGYLPEVERFLDGMRDSFREFIDALRENKKFNKTSRKILYLLPSSSERILAYMNKHDEPIRFQKKVEAKRRAIEKQRRRIEQLNESREFKLVDLNVYEYVELRRLGAITERMLVVPEIVKLIKTDIKSVERMSASRMISMIPQSRLIFKPIMQGELRIAADGGYLSNQIWPKFRNFLMRTCVDTLMACCSNLTEETIDKIVKKTESCLTIYDRTKSRFGESLLKINPTGKTAFILQNTCNIAAQTELNIYMTYDLLKSNDSAYITKKELDFGLKKIKELAPWEYSRLVREA